MRTIPLQALTLFISGCVGTSSQAGAPPFQESGVIEGFYGPPWSHDDRLDIIRFMGRVGLRSYYYAPKNDPYHRSRWREPYPADQLAQLAQLAEAASASGVTFHYAISPGVSMIYSDTAEYRTLLDKLTAVEGMGVHHFALFLDDVPPTLSHEVDRTAYANLAAAHADLINRLHADLVARGAKLSVTPTTYTDAWGDQEYVRQLGREVDSDVPFFWTGSDVVAPTITADDGRVWTTLLSRTPIIWDNYPVNDFARWRLFLGPVRGRARDLSSTVSGILSNPMNEAHASMIPLATLAEYVRDPAAYRPEAALRRAVVGLYGDEAWDLLQPFLRFYGDYSTDTNVFEPLYFPGRPTDVREIGAALQQLETASTALDRASRDNTSLAALAEELAAVVSRTRDRLTALETNPDYELHGGRLIYRRSLDTITAPRTPHAIIVDGRLDEWTTDWHPLHHPTHSGERPPPRVALAHDGERLYMALHVPVPPRSIESGDRIGEGDHVAIVIQHDTAADRTELSPKDLAILFPAPTDTAVASAVIFSFTFEGFMARYLGDNRALTFSEFHLSNFGEQPNVAMRRMAQEFEYVAWREGDGYYAELSLPLPPAPSLRLNLSVTVTENGARWTYGLSRRNFPANPATYATITFPERRGAVH